MTALDIMLGRCPKYNKNTLSTDITKQEAVKQAQVLWVNVRTMEDWIEKMIKQAYIERFMKGMYQKIICQIA